MKNYLFAKVVSHWGEIILCCIISIVIIVNFKPGYFILGNDNFSPEINPVLSLERSIMSPGWRAYRAMGIASDSEQADIFRTSIFLILNKFFPAWFVSQGYVFFTLFIASISMAYLASKIISKIFINKFQQMPFLFGGIFYMASLLTSWIYFSPVHLFVAAYAFLPLVLWQLYNFIEQQSIKNTLLLLVSSLLLSTSALTATMFLICSLTIISFSILFSLITKLPIKTKIYAILLGLFIILGIQSYWAFSFINYGKNNAKALQNSAINRNITNVTLQTERKNNTWIDTLRYYFSWMDTKENPNVLTFTYRNWYKKSIEAQSISFIPVILSIVGVFYLFKKRKRVFFVIPLLTFIGWVLIKGSNPPLGFIFEEIQNSFPIISQVFRWQSSKFWPFLAITIPVMSSIGLIYLYSVFPKRIKNIFVTIVVFAMLVFVYPYFKGDLIREKSFVKVPKEYFDLARYLEKNDRFSRIYLAPEANTLYFRNYSWGFWGSVFLNYLIPNPIVEKALIIGSFENEQAFTVIKNSYYSENPSIFSSALRTYGIDLVLFDEYASRGDVGYFYDSKIAKKMIEQNEDFEAIWKEGKLTLYIVKNRTALGLEKVYFDSDFTKLNQILNTLSGQRHYYSKEKEDGAIYPFALNFDSVELKKDEIIGKLIYKGNGADYSFLPQNNFNQTPTQITFNAFNNELFLYPLLPFLEIGNRAYLYNLPYQIYKTNIVLVPTFVAVNNQVVDFRNEGLKAVSTFYDDLKNSIIYSFSSKFRTVDLISNKNNLLSCDTFSVAPQISVNKAKLTKCQSVPINLEKDSVIEALMQFESTSKARAILCVESNYKKQCLNKNVTAFIEGDTDLVSILIPHSFQKGDDVKIYLNFEGQETTAIVIKKFDLKIFNDSQVTNLSHMQNTDFAMQADISIVNGEEIKLHIPIYSGDNSWILKSDNVFIPESSVSFLNNSVVPKNSGLIFLNHKGSSDIYPNIGFIDGRLGIGMVAIDAYNEAGIPLSLNLKNRNTEFPIWDRQIFSKTKTNLLDLFLFPDKIVDYKVGARSEGIGPIQTENMLNSLAIQVLPKTWYMTKLTPHNISSSNLFTFRNSFKIETNTYIGEAESIKDSIYVIPTAYSKDWRLSVNDKTQDNRVLVNGWQQGWQVDQIGKAKVIFAQNRIIYIGFLPLILIVGFVIARAFRTLLTKGG